MSSWIFSTTHAEADAIGKMGLTASDIEGIRGRLEKIHQDLKEKSGDPDVLREEMMAWLKLGEPDEKHLVLLETYADEIKAKCDYLVVIGIGGSSLGAKALLIALNYLKPCLSPEIIFLENADPETLAAFENKLSARYGRVSYAQVAVNVISKSGTTAETAANFEIVLQHMKESGLSDRDISRQVFATTDLEKGTLRKLSLERGYRTLVVPDGVGGRFSVFSDVGLLPLAAGGIDIRKLLAGVRSGLDRALRGVSDPENIGFELGSLLYLLDTLKGAHLHGLFFYGEAFEGIAAWFEQLWAESLGKNGRGPRPLGMIGVKAQHGVHQDNVGGKPNKAIILIGVREPRAKCGAEASEGALTMSMIEYAKCAMSAARNHLAVLGRPSMELSISRIDEENLGELLFTLEISTHVAGMLYGVNPYDQPAVEEAKTGARNALKEAQKIAPKDRKVKKIQAPALDLGGIMEGGIGGTHGLLSEECLSVAPFLGKIRTELDTVLKQEEAQNTSLDWMTETDRVELHYVQRLADEIASQNDVLVVIGIGGAVQSSKVLAGPLNFLGKKDGRPEILFVENLDPESLVRLEEILKQKCGADFFRMTALNVISQSGETAETLLNYEAVRLMFLGAGCSKELLKQKIVVTTNSEKGRLVSIAMREGYRRLDFSLNVMGLLGVFGAPGLFPLAVSGGRLDQFWMGIQNAKARAVRAHADPQNHAFRLAEAFYLLDTKKSKDLHGFFLYGDAFKAIGDWIEQLWAETLGKSECVGPRPLVMIGTTAQHSVNQDNIDGRNDKVILFMGTQVMRADFRMAGEAVDYLATNRMSELLLACMEGTRQALTARNRPNMTLILPEMSEIFLAELLYTFGITVHILGRLYGVDPYHQPQMEEEKGMIRRMWAEGRGTLGFGLDLGGSFT